MNHTSENIHELRESSPRLSIDPTESRASSDRLNSDVRTAYSRTASARGSTSLINKPHKRRFDFSGSWLWEIICAAFAVIGIASLVGFLIRIHGTRYADWQYTAAPNTVISIIMTITEAALLVPITACLGQLKWNLYRRPASLEYMQAIDEASRGSFGSFQILYRAILGSKTGILTFYGAFLTVIALAVDPFAQQILTFPLRPTQSSNDTAFIQYAHNYSSGIQEYIGSDNVTSFGLSSLLPRAILSGLSLSNTSLQPECSSGSCSYPKFVSLGVCGQCEKVTEQTTHDCQGAVLKIEGSSLTLSDPGLNCTYTAPYGFNVTLNTNNFFSHPEDGMISQSGSTYFFDMGYWSSIPRQSGKIFDIESPIVSFITISLNGSIIYTANNLTASPKLSFTECAFYWCEKEYAPTNYSGYAAGIPILQTQQLLSRTGGPLTPLSKSLSNDTSYYVPDVILEDLPIALESVFNGTSYSKGFLGENAQSGLTITSLLQLSNITEVVDSISTKLTDTIRDSNHRIRGTAFRDEAFIDVRWPWIILPLCVVLGSASLLLATAVATRKENTVVCKTSVLPLLMSDLDIASEYKFNSLRNVDEVKRISKKIVVILEQDDGLRLSEI
ncbi:hypothetical protein BO83DRAFT_219960 [Aspergillus eucalypticola CBS 122712]|uniref:Uncharacterized protein n=1 Tax=Aspergillus eucalypticola (strain CBS 122712 / IBT 29274) TaxID=1448314 RepID=A0A317UHW8_ASPEC|nr:uncharacterized protein BO83DRAFT_219960 [Aspergillus eucalypticola CBS 122712]PWY61674.1 hypothetical protein BO83DRAFT_219960 [Aspergillus eucalypticola CBS 122712]